MKHQTCKECGRKVEVVKSADGKRQELCTHGPGKHGEFICVGSGDKAMVRAARHLKA